jgi:hypothetical protein
VEIEFRVRGAFQQCANSRPPNNLQTSLPNLPRQNSKIPERQRGFARGRKKQARNSDVSSNPDAKHLGAWSLVISYRIFAG